MDNLTEESPYITAVKLDGRFKVARGLLDLRICQYIPIVDPNNYSFFRGGFPALGLWFTRYFMGVQEIFVGIGRILWRGRNLLSRTKTSLPPLCNMTTQLVLDVAGPGGRACHELPPARHGRVSRFHGHRVDADGATGQVESEV